MRNRNVLRNTIQSAMVGFAILIGSGAGAQTLEYGVFRENAPELPDGDRNCWVQAMVSGSTINGELLAERITQSQAQCFLRRSTRRGVCASQRTSNDWAARSETSRNRGWNDPAPVDGVDANATVTPANGNHDDCDYGRGARPGGTGYPANFPGHRP
jgi:hypothetical protein